MPNWRAASVLLLVATKWRATSLPPAAWYQARAASALAMVSCVVKVLLAMTKSVVSFDEAGFRFALNQDAMATEKLAEGIRLFAVDAGKLDQMIVSL